MVSSSLLLLLTPITHTPRPVTERDTPRELATKPPTSHRILPDHRSFINRPAEPPNTQHHFLISSLLFRRAVSLGGILFILPSFHVWVSLAEKCGPLTALSYFMSLFFRLGATACQFSDARLQLRKRPIREALSRRGLQELTPGVPLP